MNSIIYINQKIFLHKNTSNNVFILQLHSTLKLYISSLPQIQLALLHIILWQKKKQSNKKIKYINWINKVNRKLPEWTFNTVPTRSLPLCRWLHRQSIACRAFSSKMGSPVRRESAANSKIIVPAQAVHVSLEPWSLGDFMPYLRFTWKQIYYKG